MPCIRSRLATTTEALAAVGESDPPKLERFASHATRGAQAARTAGHAEFANIGLNRLPIERARKSRPERALSQIRSGPAARASDFVMSWLDYPLCLAQGATTYLLRMRKADVGGIPCGRPRRQKWPATTFAGSRK
jgi:hypothetical protein